MLRRLTVLAVAIWAASLAHAEHVAPVGTITITIQDNACKNAPNYPPSNLFRNCKGNTAISTAGVRIQSDDHGVAGHPFDAQALYAGMTARDTGLGKGVCPLMAAVPAQKVCESDADGKLWREPTLLTGEAVADLVDGMSPGSNLAWELARHFDETDPFMLPVFTDVEWIEDNKYDDARVASWVVLSGRLTWCLPDAVTLVCE